MTRAQVLGFLRRFWIVLTLIVGGLIGLGVHASRPDRLPLVAAGPRPIATVPSQAGVMTSDGGTVAGTALANGALVSDGGSIGYVTPGTAGNALVSTGTGWSSQAVNTNGWTTVLDCDLTAESTQNLNTLGTFTMCGVTPWRNEPANNTANFNNGGNYVTNPSGTLDLTNGSGLVFAQILAAQSEWGSFTANNNNMRGGSAVWISLANIGVPAGFTWTSQIRVWVNVSSQSISECLQRSGLAMGIDNDQYHGGGVSGQGKWVGFFGARTCSSTTNPAFESDVIIGTGSSPTLGTSATGQTSWNANNATTVVYTGPIGRFGGNAGAEPLTLWQSQYSGGWANEATLIPWAASQRAVGDVQTNDTGIGFLNADGGVDIRTRYGVVLAAFKMSTTVAGSITVSRLRVDYKL